MAVYEFWVYARNTYNAQVFSEKVTVNVIWDCSKDTISVLDTDVSKSLAGTINPLVGRFWEIQNKPRLVF